MAWTAKVSPGSLWSLNNAWWAPGTTRWLVVSSADIGATDDFEVYDKTLAPTNPNNGNTRIVPLGACYDGTRWHVVGDAGYLRSTDGLTGAAWEVSNAINASVGIHGARAIAASGSRLVAISSTGRIMLSTDSGATWVVKRIMSSPGTYAAGYSVAHRDGVWMVSANAGNDVSVSTNNGDNWVGYNPLSGLRSSSVGSAPGGVWKVSPASSLGANRVTTNNGVSWAADAFGSRLAEYHTTPDAMYEVVGGVPPTVYSYESIVRDAVDMTGLPGVSAIVRAGDRLVAMRPGTGGAAPYVAPGVNSALYATTPWPVVIVPAEYVTTSWPVDVVPAPERRASTLWRVTVATAQQSATGWPVQVLDAARVGGLDGAASWAAAPDGRWEAVVWLGADNISARILGTVSVQIEADAARTAEFSFVPSAPIQPLGLIGQRVRLAFAQAGGLNAQTIFRGVVETPTIDLQTGVITCACHDQAQEVWANTPRETIDPLVGGRWHVAVSGEPEDNFEYLRERIQSVGASWALDASQAPRILPWASPARTVTVRQADVIDGSLAVDLPSREQLRTRIDVRMQYRYPVHRGRGISAQWSQPLSFFLPRISATMPKNAYTFPTVGTIETAAGSPPGWDLVTLQIENPSAGTFQLGTELEPAFYIIPYSVAPALAIGFSGTYRTRWQQTVTEDYGITVVWDALEAQIGQPVGEEIGATLESAFDAPGWGSDQSVEPQINVLGVGDVSLPYYAPGAAPADRDEVLRTLLDRAWVRLWSASRTGRVRFALPCRPDLWLDIGCILEGGRVRASGVIVALEHILDVDAGQATTDIAVAVGMPGATPAALPAWSLPASPYVPALPSLDQLSATIGTYVGGLSSSPPFDAETMIGLVTNEDGAEVAGRNYYPVGLTIGWPDLTADDRDPRELTAAAVVSVAVPTDTLEIL